MLILVIIIQLIRGLFLTLDAAGDFVLLHRGEPSQVGGGGEPSQGRCGTLRQTHK